MKNLFSAAPTWEVLKGLEVHEVVRDYPELLLPLKQKGVELQEGGPRGLLDVLLDRHGEAKALALFLAWRGTAGR